MCFEMFPVSLFFFFFVMVCVVFSFFTVLKSFEKFEKLFKNNFTTKSRVFSLSFSFEVSVKTKNKKLKTKN